MGCKWDRGFPGRKFMDQCSPWEITVCVGVLHEETGFSIWMDRAGILDGTLPAALVSVFLKSKK